MTRINRFNTTCHKTTPVIVKFKINNPKNMRNVPVIGKNKSSVVKKAAITRPQNTKKAITDKKYAKKNTVLPYSVPPNSNNNFRISSIFNL